METLIENSGIEAEKIYKESSLNCAQSVFTFFKDKYNIDDEFIKEARLYGGGRAPEGLCGALYAALNIIDLSDEEKNILKSNFNLAAGSMKCREIRKLKKLSCAECVKTSAGLFKVFIS